MNKNDFYAWCYGSTFRERYVLPKIQPFPLWAKDRPGWHYCGWDSGGTFLGTSFKERCVKKYDHGERRKTDIYKEVQYSGVKNRGRYSVYGKGLFAGLLVITMIPANTDLNLGMFVAIAELDNANNHCAR